MYHYSHIQTPSDVALRNILFELHDFKNRQYDLLYYNQQLKEVLMLFGSQTPDNLQVLEKIVYGEVNGNWNLKLKNAPLLISELWKSLEQLSMLRPIQKQLPDLTPNEWKASMRLVSLILQDIAVPFGLLMNMKEVWELGTHDRISSTLLSKVNQKLSYLFDTQKQSSLSNHIEFGKSKVFENWVIKWGLRTRKSNIFLSDLVAEIENISPPAEFLKLKNIEPTDWEAAMRIIVLIISVFEGSRQMEAEGLFQ